MWYGSRTIANKLQEEDQTPADDTYEDDFAFSSDDGGGHGTNGSSREHTNGREKETEHINTRTADNEQSTEKSWSSSSDAYSRDAYEGDEGEEEEEEQLEGEGGRKTGKIDRKATASATLRKKRRERREGRKKQRQKAAMTMKVEETCPASTSTFETVQQQRANEGRRKETEENKNREVDDIEVAKDISDEISPLLQTSEEERSKQTKRSVDHMEIVTEMDKPTEYHNHHILTKNGGEEKEEGRLNHMLRTPDSKQSAPGKCKDGKTSLPVSGFKSRRSAKHRREIRKRNNGTSKSDGKSWGNSNGKNHSGKNHGQRKGRTDIDIDMNDRNENSTYERNNKPRRRRTESRYGSHTSVVNTHEKEKGNDEATDERLNIHSASYIRSKYEGLMKSSHPYAQQRGKHR